MQAGLAALQRTHEVYRLAREKVEAREKARGDEVGAADGVYVTPAPGDGESARAVAERELSESLRLARGAHAGQAVAGRRAAEEREQLQAALREAREVAAQRAAYSREELLQERQRRAKLETERQAEAATSEVARLTAEQRLQTQAASAKRETATLEAMLIDAQARRRRLSTVAPPRLPPKREWLPAAPRPLGPYPGTRPCALLAVCALGRLLRRRRHGFASRRRCLSLLRDLRP